MFKSVIVTKENAHTPSHTHIDTVTTTATNEQRGKNKSIFRISINLMVIKSRVKK